MAAYYSNAICTSVYAVPGRPSTPYGPGGFSAPVGPTVPFAPGGPGGPVAPIVPVTLHMSLQVLQLLHVKNQTSTIRMHTLHLTNYKN